MASLTEQGRVLLDGAGVTVGGDQPYDIQVHDDRFWRRVLRDRELGLGETYQEGWWDAIRVDEFLVRVLTADLRSAIRASPALLLNVLRSNLVNRQTVRRAGHNARAPVSYTHLTLPTIYSV